MREVIEMSNNVYSVDRLKNYVIDTLNAIGINKDHASIVADVLLEADLRGIESHGVARLSIYVKKNKIWSNQQKSTTKSYNRIR